MTPGAATAPGADAAPGPRRVAIVIYGLIQGGAERVVTALSSRWTDEGREVTVVTLAGPEHDVYALPPRVRRIALRVAADSRGPVDAARAALSRAVALRRAVGAAGAEVVISFMTATNALSILAMAGTGVPVIACERTDPRWADPGRSWAVLRRLLYPRASAVAVQTESVAGWARRFCRRVHVIPNFVERPDPAGAVARPWPGKVLVGMGRLVPSKGFDLLVRAFAAAAADRPEWSLAILGDGPERPRLLEVAASAGVADRVHLPGHVADPIAVLRGADAFALSSLYEGFPNALLEAMACGLPVVSFDCPSGPSDAIMDGVNGLLVPVGDAAALSAALARVLSDAALRERLGRSATDVATRLSPERVLPLWSELLRAATTGGRA